MCGRFTLTAEAKELAKRLGVEVSASFYKNVAPRYNIAPTQPVVLERQERLDGAVRDDTVLVNETESPGWSRGVDHMVNVG
jgi:putative SOS response-associated peptidase YedK